MAGRRNICQGFTKEHGSHVDKCLWASQSVTVLVRQTSLLVIGFNWLINYAGLSRARAIDHVGVQSTCATE